MDAWYCQPVNLGLGNKVYELFYIMERENFKLVLLQIQIQGFGGPILDPDPDPGF